MSNVSKKLVGGSGGSSSGSKSSEEELPEELKGLDKVLVDRIESDIIQNGQPVTFEQIAGLKTVKDIVQEIICWPMLRPDLFVGLRALPRGLLLFGPPGTGKVRSNTIVHSHTYTCLLDFFYSSIFLFLSL